MKRSCWRHLNIIAEIFTGRKEGKLHMINQIDVKFNVVHFKDPFHNINRSHVGKDKIFLYFSHFAADDSYFPICSLSPPPRQDESNLSRLNTSHCQTN